MVTCSRRVTRHASSHVPTPIPSDVTRVPRRGEQLLDDLPRTAPAGERPAQAPGSASPAGEALPERGDAASPAGERSAGGP